MVTRNPSFEERVARVLISGEFINEKQLEEARQRSTAGRTGLLEALLATGSVSRETLATVVGFQLRVPLVDLRQVQVDQEALKLIPHSVAQEHQILPVGFMNDGALRVITKSPNDFQLSSQLSSMAGRQIRFALALGEGLDTLIERFYGGQKGGGETTAPGPTTVTQAGPATETRLPQLGGVNITNLPAVQAVEMVTLQAVKRQASDVHMLPVSDSAKVLFRVDGELQQVALLPLSLHESMVSRVKVLAGLDIAEKRRPQDGSFSMQFGEKKVDFRVSTVGIAWGEMMVVRVLEKTSGLFALKEIGLDAAPLQLAQQLLSLPYGLFLVSGPTGSGKTTTLYAAVTELISDRGNIMTVEDPIEYRFEEIQQIEVNRAAGIDFPAGLKAIMRLDPDIILVGEIRDTETAKTAVDAALTGHLVLASIHSNDAASALVRLLDLGVERYLVATSILGALAQRLVRKICEHCKVQVDLSDAEAILYEQEMQEPAGRFWVGQGCNFCNRSGYSGRTGVFEVLPVRDSIRKLVTSGASGQQIKEQALADGMISLRRAGLLKAKAGITTIREVMQKVFTIE